MSSGLHYTVYSSCSLFTWEGHCPQFIHKYLLPSPPSDFFKSAVVKMTQVGGAGCALQGVFLTAC